MKLESVLFEAKLTEADFQSQNATIVEGYRDLNEVFERRKLPRRGREYVSYQLLRNVLAVHALTFSCLRASLRRRPDLLEDWHRVMARVRPTLSRPEIRNRARWRCDPVLFATIRVVMAVVVEMHNTGDSATRSEIVALIEHALCERTGEWRVSIVGSRGSDDWEMKIEGPKGLERHYTLLGSAGQHQPEAIRSVLLRLLPAGA
jgi:hypothetical protein